MDGVEAGVLVMAMVFSQAQERHDGHDTEPRQALQQEKQKTDRRDAFEPDRHVTDPRVRANFAGN